MSRSDAADTSDAADALARARTSIEAGDFAAARQLCREVLDSGTGGALQDAALKTLLHSLIPLGELAEANRTLDELRAATASAPDADAWEARLRFAEGDWAAAVECAQRLPEEEQTKRDQLAEIEIKSLFALGRHREAADLLRACLAAGTVPLTVAEMAEALAADGGGLAEAVARVPAAQRRTLLYAAREAPVEFGDQVLEALWELPGEQDAVLGVAGRVGRYLPLHRALLWSSRLREHGHAVQCPLLRIAAQPERGALERVLAAALAMERFDDPAALPLLSEALDEVPAEEEAAVLAELRQHAPGVADAVEPVPAG